MSQADGDVIWRALTSISSDENAQGTAEVVEPDSPSPGHFGVQATLAKFGLATGCEVWVPKNDRQRVTRAAPEIADSRLLGRLPIAFGGIAEETIANIDVLWFKGRRIVAAFEVEHSTSIYSGLLRMADLASVFPNLPFPLYVVAPDDRRAAVRAEITRPVFDRLSPPLSEVARFIGYQRLADLIAANPPESHAYLDPAVIAMASEAFGQ